MSTAIIIAATKCYGRDVTRLIKGCGCPAITMLMNGRGVSDCCYVPVIISNEGVVEVFFPDRWPNGIKVGYYGGTDCN
jgi:hypothetical protein